MKPTEIVPDEPWYRALESKAEINEEAKFERHITE